MVIQEKCDYCRRSFSVSLRPHEKEGNETGSVLRDCPYCGREKYVWTGIFNRK